MGGKSAILYWKVSWRRRFVGSEVPRTKPNYYDIEMHFPSRALRDKNTDYDSLSSPSNNDVSVEKTVYYSKVHLSKLIRSRQSTFYLQMVNAMRNFK